MFAKVHRASNFLAQKCSVATSADESRMWLEGQCYPDLESGLKEFSFSCRTSISGQIFFRQIIKSPGPSSFRSSKQLPLRIRISFKKGIFWGNKICQFFNKTADAWFYYLNFRMAAIEISFLAEIFRIFIFPSTHFIIYLWELIESMDDDIYCTRASNDSASILNLPLSDSCGKSNRAR